MNANYETALLGWFNGFKEFHSISINSKEYRKRYSLFFAHVTKMLKICDIFVK